MSSIITGVGCVLEGIFMKSQYQKFEFSYIIFFYTFVCAGTLAILKAFSEADTLSEKSEVAYALTAALCVFSYFLNFQLNKAKIRELYHRLENIHEEGSPLFNEISNNKCWAIIKKFRYHVLNTYLITNSIPIFIALATEEKLGTQKTLILPSFYPWSNSTKFGYIVTMLVQLMTTTLGYLTLLTFITSFFPFMVTIDTFNEIIGRKLSTLRVLARNVNGGVERTESYERIINTRIATILKDYNEMVRLSHDVTRIAVRTANIILCGVFLSVILLISIFIRVPGNYLYRLKLLSACTMVFFTFCYYCTAGEYLSALNDRTRTAIYSSSWYYFDAKSKKTILTLLILCQKPLMLKSFNMFFINLSFSLTILKICYQFIQLLSLQTK